mmetsp:Transcript_65994/g.132471  ORF Transcript_65994/g.132471 Transcript_65994/m.132471 type:complete len:201 (+) Transcript_65994:325-927(+)
MLALPDQRFRLLCMMRRRIQLVNLVPCNDNTLDLDRMRDSVLGLQERDGRDERSIQCALLIEGRNAIRQRSPCHLLPSEIRPRHVASLVGHAGRWHGEEVGEPDVWKVHFRHPNAPEAHASGTWVCRVSYADPSTVRPEGCTVGQRSLGDAELPSTRRLKPRATIFAAKSEVLMEGATAHGTRCSPWSQRTPHELDLSGG